MKNIRLEFQERGGYDCLSDAWKVLRGYQDLVTVDLADFGDWQERPPTEAELAEAERIAQACFKALKDLPDQAADQVPAVPRAAEADTGDA
jgi:hypothetical protein